MTNKQIFMLQMKLAGIELSDIGYEEKSTEQKIDVRIKIADMELRSSYRMLTGSKSKRNEIENIVYADIMGMAMSYFIENLFKQKI